MKLTPEQIDILRKCENGVDVSNAKEILEFLIEIGFCDPPSTLAQTKIYSNQAGKAFLYTYDELQIQIDKNKSNAKKTKKKEFFIQVFLVFLGAVLALLFEHYGKIFLQSLG